VVETDYTGYALIYSCVAPLWLRAEFVWVLTRSKNPWFWTLNAIETTHVAKLKHYDSSILVRVD
jgi:hypothetical protein